MPLVIKNKISTSTALGIWKMDEIPNDFFGEKISSVKNHIRKKEIYSTELLIKELCGKNSEIFYDENGKPHLKNSTKKISISHSHKYVAAIIEKRFETGIDIQKITPKILKIQKKFLHKKELEFIAKNKNKLEIIHVIWGAKECLYKAHGKGKIIFSENIFVDPFPYKNCRKISAHLILQNEKKSFHLHYEKRDDYMLVYIADLTNIVK